MRAPRVVHLTTVHPVFDTRIFYKEAETLARAGYEVILIAQHDKNEVVDEVKIIPLPKPKNRFIRIFALTWRAFFLALRQRAVIHHFHDPELLPIGLLLKLFTRAKVIYDVHENVPEQILTKYWIPARLRRPVAAICNIIEQCIAGRLDAVVTATEGIAEKFWKLNPVVVHNYPDLEMLANASRIPEEKREKVLVYTGLISRLRGAFEMVRALEYLDHIDNLRLDLIGKFDPPSLEKELQKMLGYRRVHFIGWLQPTQVYKRLKEADIGLVCLHPEPRFIDALPVKLFEYMGVGLPVVASNFPLWRKIVEENQCGICVNPLDPQEIARAIEYLVTHPGVAREMGERGRRAVEEKYNWEREAEKLCALYKELLQP